MRPARALFRRHDPASQTRYQELKALAATQRRVLAGTPGVLKQRTKSGNRYWVREYIRVDGSKVDDHLGAESAVEKARLEEWRAGIELARALAAGSAQLRLFNYQRMERKPAAVLEALYNRGLVAAGLTLVGSHTYGALLNECGALVRGYREMDLGVDVHIPGGKFQDLEPFRELGVRVSPDPLLDFLIGEPIDGVILSPNQVIPVKLPSPERFVLHKLYASQSRTDRGKAPKDLDQAATLAAVLEEDMPGRLLSTFRRMPSAGKPATRRGARAAARRLEGLHSQAEDLLRRIAG